MSKRKPKIKPIVPPTWPTRGTNTFLGTNELVEIDLNRYVKDKTARTIQVRINYMGSVHVVTLTRNY